jgi:hypothetical protein
MATIPSLALIPSGYKASKVYSVLPTDGTGDFDFTRSGNATRVNSEGLIELVSTNVPRLNYPLIDGVVSGCPSLLLEPQRINLITYSEELSNWTNIQNVTVTDNQIISPDGTLNASRINETTDNEAHRIFLNPTVANAQHSFSVFMKAGTRDWCYLRLDSQSSDRAWFNIKDGVIGTVDSDLTASIEDYGNGWFRCTVVSQGVTFDTTPLGIIAITTGDNVQSYVGDVNEYIYAWGVQLEAGSYPTSYIPTSGTIETRSAETCNGAGDVNTFNDSEGVLFAEIADIKNNDGVEKRLAIQDGGTFDAVRITFTPTTNSITGVVYNNGATQCNLVHVVSNTENFNKIALKYKANDFALWVNGIEVATDNSGTVFNNGALDKLSFDLFNNAKVYGSTKQLQYFDTALTDSELETLTSWTSFSEMATSQLYTIE